MIYVNLYKRMYCYVKANMNSNLKYTYGPFTAYIQ
jgi:hypothetical protein